MLFTTITLPLQPELRTTLPAVVADVCDWEGGLHDEMGWEGCAPTLLAFGADGRWAESCNQGDVLAWLRLMAQHAQQSPVFPAPAAGVALVRELIVAPDGTKTLTHGRVAVGVLREDALFTVSRFRGQRAVLEWPGQTSLWTHPFVEPLRELLEAHLVARPRPAYGETISAGQRDGDTPRP